jgi:hypothetical protein
MDPSLQHHWKEAVSRTMGCRSSACNFLSRSDERALRKQAGGYYEDADDMCESMERVAREGYDAAIEILSNFVMPNDCKDIEAAGQAVIAHLKALPACQRYYEALGISRALADLRQAVAIQRGKIRLASEGYAKDPSQKILRSAS